MRPSRLAHRAVALLAGVAVLAACSGENGGGDEAGGEDGGGTLRVAVARMAASVDPGNDQTSSYLRSYGAAEALAKIQPDGSVEPELAASIESTGESEWTVVLREGATFWSGDPVDADAVVASLERSRAESALAAGVLTGVAVEATDPGTLVFTTPGPSRFFDYSLASYSLVVHNAGTATSAEPTDVAAADLTGPFRITGFETERSVTLKANPDWWGGEPALAGVDVQLVPDEQSRAELALSGQADVVQDLPSARAAETEAAGLQVASAPGSTTVAVYLNPASAAAPALADQRVRQALAWGVDRQEVVDLATDGLSVPSPSWLASSPAYPAAADQGYTEVDAERAGELLDEAGWTLGADGTRSRDGQPLTFRLLTFGAEGPTGEVLQAQWAELGINVQVRQVESTLSTQALESGDWDAVTQAWTTLGNAATLIGNQVLPDGAANHGGYEIPGVAELLATASTSPDEAEREAALLEVNQSIVDVVPSVPVHPRVSVFALAAGVEGFVPHPLQYETIVQPDMTVP